MARLRKILAENVKALREYRGLAQVELAAATDLDRGYISAIENERYAASCDTLEKLGDAFEIDPKELLDADTAKKYRTTS